MVAKHKRNVAGGDHRGTPSLVDVLCQLAGYWILCECGTELKRAGHAGWHNRVLQLAERIDLLNAQLPVVESPARKKTMQAELKQLQAQSQAINEEWEQAHEEADTYRELFWEAREFCTRSCGLGDHELFNAALVGFDPERLPPEHGPAKHRMTEITMQLSNLPRDTWTARPWAYSTKPTMRATRRVAPNKTNSFILQHLKHLGTASGTPGEASSQTGLNADAKATSARRSVDEAPYLGLVFHHDSTVTRIGYKDNLPIQLAPQRLKLLKFVHEAGVLGRTQSAIIPRIIADRRTLTTEKNRIREDLRPFDLDLGPRGQYVVRCTRTAIKKSL